MDPNAALRRIRESIADMDSTQDDDELYYAFTALEHFRALDEWLSKGGFKPNEWV